MPNTNVITLMVARNKDGSSKYGRSIFIPKYGKDLQDMPNGAALIMNNEEDKKFLEDVKKTYQKPINEKKIIIYGETHGNNPKHT